jgi:collagen type VI alpha
LDQERIKFDNNLADGITSLFGSESKLRVIKSYVQAPTPPNKNDASLYYAACASSISLSHPTATIQQSQLAPLAQLSAQSGLSYVSFADPHLVHVSSPPSSCESPLDLVILLDSSGSIDSSQFGGAPGTFATKVLPFVKQLVGNFAIGVNATRVAIVSFASSVVVNFSLNTYSTTAEVLTAIDGITYLNGGTANSLVINTVRTSIFTEANGIRPLSADIPRVMIIITDGQANFGFDSQNEATRLRESLNVNIFAVGVGCDLGMDELKSVATDPDSMHVYPLKSFFDHFHDCEPDDHSCLL